jgi:perosamine synthetase
MTIPYGRQSVDERDVEAVIETLRSAWLTQGPAVDSFEEAIAEACDAPFAVTFSSGTAALHGAAFAAGVGPGDELVTSALTFSASANCGAYLGARPRFADIDPATWNVTGDSLAAELTDSTRAVVPVHFTGLPAPIDEIRRAVGDDVAIIEDAAHALGANVAGVPVGSCRVSDMAMFSLHPLKTITTGEGGVVTTRSEELRDRLREFRNHGFVLAPADASQGGWYREQHVLGFNYRLSDIHASLGHSQLGKLRSFVARRNEVAARYRSLLADVPELELPPEPPDGTTHAYHLFVVLHRDRDTGRRKLYDGLRERGILPQVHYIPVYWHPYYRETFGYERGLCPVAEDYYAGCLSLPCFPALTEDQQDEVVAAIREVLAA